MTSLSSSKSSATADSNDPHKFLENVLGEESLSWVKERNQHCIGALGDPQETDEYKRILAILDSKDKIPGISQIGSSDKNNNGMFYNFWQDENHVQGIWRKTTLESYQTNDPEWHTVLDLDALEPYEKDKTIETKTAEDDDETKQKSTWVWKGSSLLDEGSDGKWDRAIISLSPGGSDATVKREMDLTTEQFIDPTDGDGFAFLTAAKTSMAYRSRDEVLIGTDFNGDGSTMTDSGYPRVIKSWKRGTDISTATTVWEVEQADISCGQYAYHDREDTVHEFRYRSMTFYTTKYEYRSLTPQQLQTNTADTESVPFQTVPIQEDATIYTFGKEAMIDLRSDWEPTEGEDEKNKKKTYKAGSLLSLPMSDVMEQNWSNIHCLFEPTDTISLQGTTTTKDYVILSVLDDVRTKLVIWKFEGADNSNINQKWTLLSSSSNKNDDNVPVGEDVTVRNINRDNSMNNAVFLWRDGYLKPDSVELVDDVEKLVKQQQEEKEESSPSMLLRSKPAMFDASNLCVEQYFCTSIDGITKIPYFLIRRKDMKFDGSNPTLVDAYGGFEISMLPGYSAGVGAAWLEAGGVKVIANIRGGGEYGPKWHQSALKEHRYKCFEDMEAIALDLINNLKVTSPEKLACIGGSNGGLLVGNIITRPLSSKLYGAAVCQVPLLDMKVYSKLLAGASWMAEYGDPDKPEEWAFLRKHSPYHLLRHDILGLPEEEEGATKNNDDTNKNDSGSDWKCPKVLFTTSTRDDRVHPAHARKMVRSLLEEAQPIGKADDVYYWENVEGGHGGAADNKQRAYMWALTYSFLKQTLGLGKQ